MGLSDERRGVLGSVLAGMAVSLGALGAALAVPPMRALIHGGIHSRLDFWTGWALPAILPLLLTIGMLAQHRLDRAEDLGAEPGARSRDLQAAVRSTLEQTVLWLAVTLIWAVRMPVQTLGVVPVAAILFLVGRALFLRGHGHRARGRALGFGITFYPILLMALLLALERIGVPFG